MAVLPVDQYYSGRNRTVTEQFLRTNAERYSLILTNESAGDSPQIYTLSSGKKVVGGVCIDNPANAALLAC